VLIEEVPQDVFSAALKDINDPLVPIKAHGYVELRKLIDKKDHSVEQNLNKIMDLSLRGVKHEDSYLYLAAINCMLSLSVMYPHKLLEPLIEQFMGEKLDVENRLKVGEILTKTVRGFGELVPVYGKKLIGAFLVGVRRSDDEIYKASCLSNLGELCKLMNYSIQENVFEILSCLSSYLDTDESVQVKRAAALVLKMIVEGLRKESFVQMLGPALTPLYKLLVKVKRLSGDDVVRLNCELASEYINEMMKSSMFPKQVLQKEIKVLRP
jgi:hypothetical protein